LAFLFKLKFLALQLLRLTKKNKNMPLKFKLLLTDESCSLFVVKSHNSDPNFKATLGLLNRVPIVGFQLHCFCILFAEKLIHQAK